MKEIPLTVGRQRIPSGLLAIVDDVDYERASRMHWRVFLANRRRLYAVAGRNTLLHRFILNAPAGMSVDQINGDGLDAQRANLRLLTPSQTIAKNWSRVVGSHSTHKFKGASYLEGRARPWRATISVNGKQRFLGYYGNQVDAAKAYDAAARLYFGEFANTNFVVEE